MPHRCGAAILMILLMRLGRALQMVRMQNNQAICRINTKNAVEVGAMSVSKEVLESLGQLRESSVTLDRGENAGYMVSLEAFHHVHCLVSHG